jgi:WXG100 family type VII secretion target
MPDQSEIVVKFAALHKASQDIGTAISTMHSQLDGLNSSVAPMVAGWDGSAQAAYVTRQKQWESAAQDITSLLTQIQGAVTKSAEIMQQREQANTAKFGG